MVAWLQVNWLWILLGVGLLWFVARRGGCCGMGGHTHGTHEGHGGQKAIGEGEEKGVGRQGAAAEAGRDAVSERL
jgi:hypothetical protein